MSSRKASAMLGQSKPVSAKPPSTGLRARSATIAPWDEPANEFARDPTDIALWEQDPQARIGGTRPFNQPYFNESPLEVTPPSTRPVNSRQNSEEHLNSDLNARRPSVASNETVSSISSRKSVQKGFHRKALGTFFGDAPPDSNDPAALRKGSQTASSNDIPANNEERLRNNSIQTARSGEERPKTPLPSSNVTPWDYQNFEDVSKFGSAPIRQELGPEINGTAAKQSTTSAIKGKLLPHRHTKSKDDPKAQTLAPPSIPQRPATSRETSSNNVFQQSTPNSGTPMSSQLNLPKAQTTPVAQPETNGSSGKRGFFSKLKSHRHRDKEKHQPSETTRELPLEAEQPSQESLTGRNRGFSASQQQKKASSVPSTVSKTDRESSVASADSASTIKPPEMPKIDRTFTASSVASKTSKFPRIGHSRTRDRTMSSSQSSSAEPLKKESKLTPMWTIDTNFDDMSDILHQPPGGQSAEQIQQDAKGLPQTPATEPTAPMWDAPDSWAVKGQDTGIGTQPHDAAEGGLPVIEEEDGISYFMRVFRSDGTFATLSMLINATVGEVLQSLAKKSVLHDTIENYHLILRKNQLSRQLLQGERPIAMQKKLLVQAGYQENDHLEEVGREDNSYLCRFTFSHEKQTGFGSGLDDEPTFNKQQKFSHVDLAGRSLITIPIILYTKAPEIVSLNLSRNLALSVPKDFITACINLREIKFTGNEAWHLPQSLAWASRLNVLDLSNNRLEELDHAELHRLTGLVSLKLANNNLSKLPNNFSHFRQLRSLNISSNNFKELPEQVYNLKSLADLDFSFNRIGGIPKISSLVTLERLWMTNNDLRGPFNEGFRNLVNLKEIDARFNGVTNIDNVAGLPNLEQLLVGHNNISAFTGSFKKLRNLVLDHNPMTQFDLEEPVPTLTSLNIASAKLVEFKERIFEHMNNIQKLILDKNHFSNMPSQIGRLQKLEHLSMARNRLNAIPQSIGNLTELKHLNLRECNVKSLPAEIWYCRKLEMLNLSSNVLETFPRMNAVPPPPPAEQGHKDSQSTLTPGLNQSPSFEELGKLEDFQARRPSQASTGMLSIGSSPGGSGRKNSMVSVPGNQGRKMSQISRTNTEYSMATATRKDSNLSQARLTNTFAGSLRYLYLADNRLEDEIFRELVYLVELRMLNLSYNEIDDFPQGVLRRWPNLTDLYLSGNTLTSLPSEDFEESSNLRSLYLNYNRFQVLPAELCNVHKLSVLDVGSNSLKYNVSNWPYDWNWNRNTNLKYLNFSANRRLEIKPATTNSMNQFAAMNGGEFQDLTSFNSLKYLRVLGLMDVTLLTNTVPDDNEDRRVRTSASLAGALLYGMADTLGMRDHLSTLDLLKPNFRGHEAEIVVGMFDGQSLPSGGSKVAKYLHEHFASNFAQELNETEKNSEKPEDALRRSFLSLNKEMANYASSAIENREHRLQNGHRGSSVANMLSSDDLNAGCVACVLYLNGVDLWVANVGDIEAVIISTNGQSKRLTTKHLPAEPRERERIRAAGGYVSRQGKLNDAIEVSRAFGYFSAMPSVIAAPSTLQIQISDSDEIIVVATKEFWDFVTVELAVDVARAVKNDLMVAAQKLRDLAIAFGARDKMMVQVLGVSDLRKRNHHRFRAGSVSLARDLGSDPDSHLFPSATRRKKPRGTEVADSELARMEEPEAPVGEVAICFTDIKNSTALWEILPVPMRGGIQLHNQLMRRQLRIVGGYEVKTEGDAFMCSFPTVTSALLWCFVAQTSLLELEWPTELLDTVHCQEKFDAEGNTIYKGLSVRMGIHWGRPVCEPDPITRRMDYFGPMVNKAARVSAVADGGQISVSTDFISEIRRTLEAFAEDDDRRDSVGSEDSMNDDPMAVQIRKELRQLSSLGFEVKELGEKKLKGLENPEFIYLMYPHGLAGRLEIPPGAGEIVEAPGPQDKAEPGAFERDSSLGTRLQLEEVWKLWDVALRLEMLCSSLEDPDRTRGLRKPEMSLLTSMKERGGAISDSFLINLMEHQVTRVENCVSSLQLRHMLSPLKAGVSFADQARPVQEILKDVAEALRLYKQARPEQLEDGSNGTPKRTSIY